MVQFPAGAELDRNTRRITWRARSTFGAVVTFRLRAKNSAGSDMAIKTIQVEQIYKPQVVEVSATRTLPYPIPIVIAGYINGDFDTDMYQLPVIIRYHNLQPLNI